MNLFVLLFTYSFIYLSPNFSVFPRIVRLLLSFFILLFFFLGGRYYASLPPPPPPAASFASTIRPITNKPSSLLFEANSICPHPTSHPIFFSPISLLSFPGLICTPVISTVCHSQRNSSFPFLKHGKMMQHFFFLSSEILTDLLATKDGNNHLSDYVYGRLF